MGIQKLTNEERKIKNWRERRNRLVSQLLAKDKHLTSDEALKMANKKMGPMPGRRVW